MPHNIRIVSMTNVYTSWLLNMAEQISPFVTWHPAWACMRLMPMLIALGLTVPSSSIATEELRGDIARKQVS